ncbi:MAG: HAMP domain-containing histidine kinase [Proteobacteria bacterium]|nr:HAMP domain-containing histidine kinase [Pseudomonadota bacterium]
MTVGPDRESPVTPWARLRSLSRSLIVRLVLLVVIFGVVPVIIYARLQAADVEKQQLLLETVRNKGMLIGRALEPLLMRVDSIPYFRRGEELAKYVIGPVTLKLLFRPASTTPGSVGFFYIASAPAVSTDALAIERQRLIDDGILPRLAQSCEGDVPLALRLELPGGLSELLTSITPVRTPGGCWALIVSHQLDKLGTPLGRPYWQSPEVQVAAVIYFTLAVLTIGIFFDLWRSLLRFGRLARAVRTDQGAARFADRNIIPELGAVAREFDGMVQALRGSAVSIRRAAEDTAHSFKTPLGVIRQSLEPMRRRLAAGDERGRQAIAAIETALDRLNGLVAAARQLDETTADVLDPPRETIDLSALCHGIVEGHAHAPREDGIRLAGDIARPAMVVGGMEMIETVVENILENAISVSPPHGEVRLTVVRRGAVVALTVEDQGPGVPADRLEKIFERYYSTRSAVPGPKINGENGAAEAHFGIGLWVVRRNVEALHGRVWAENRATGGLKMTVELPALEQSRADERKPPPRAAASRLAGGPPD